MLANENNKGFEWLGATFWMIVAWVLVVSYICFFNDLGVFFFD